MSNIQYIFIVVIIIMLTGCRNDKKAIEEIYGLNLPGDFLVQRTWDNYKGISASLPRPSWDAWNIENSGFKKWVQLAEWQFFSLRHFSIENKPGDEIYVSDKQYKAKRFLLFYDAKTSDVWLAIE